MTFIDFHGRRAALEVQIADAQERQGAALLDGRPFDASGLAELHGQLNALIAAEGEQARRERDKLERQEQKRLASLRATLEQVEQDRLAACDRAQAAARELAKAMSEIVARSADAATISGALGARGGSELVQTEVETRLSVRLTHALAPLIGRRRRWGSITVPEAWERYGGSWRDGEQAVFADRFNKAMGNHDVQ